MHGNCGVKVYKMQAAARAIKTAMLMKQMQEETTNFSVILLAGKSLKILTAHCNIAPAPGLGSIRALEGLA